MSAISFGVFCRLAPSTSAIIRSMKVSPGIGGDPDDEPVGEDPGAAGDGRAVAAGLADDRGGLAGDRRLVHRGDAFDHFAVGGDEVARPAPARGRPARSSVADTDWKSRWFVRLAAAAWPGSACRVPRSASACALPRPSAIASAKLAKSTVNQSQSASWRVKPMPPRPAARSRTSDERGEHAARRAPRTSPGSAPCGAGRACRRVPQSARRTIGRIERAGCLRRRPSQNSLPAPA